MATNRQLQDLATIRKAVIEITSEIISMNGCLQHHIYSKRTWTGPLTQEFKDGIHSELRKAFPEASIYWDRHRPETLVVDYSYLPQ
jgi:hypothetical protein